jgi:uroporphyrinogen-III synthase
MRVIVTRPLDSGRRTAEKLIRLGYEPVLLPLTRPQHDSQAVATALAGEVRAIVFTSAEAIRAVPEPSLAAHRDTPVYTVGEASAKAAHAAGFRNVTAGPGTGEALARQLAEIGIEHALYLAGKPRSPAFEEGLSRFGIPVQTIEAYAMEETDWSPAQIDSLSPRPQAVLFYSREAVRLFLAREAVRKHLAPFDGLQAFCLSEAVADGIPAGLGLPVAIAAKPTEEDLLLLLSSGLEPKSL